MAWTEFTYLFVIALFCAGLDAFMIGANDVANSWATSVSSRSLTLKQALLGAAILEFLGAVLVGARVAGTIRNNIIDIRVFNQDAGVILLAFTCVTVGASTWLTIATFNGMPVSTTHTVIGAIIGVGIAVGGGGAVRWGWNGVAQIIASWFIAPGVAGGLAAIVFLLCKFCILRRKNPKKLAVLASPIFFFVVPCVLTTSIIVKGSPSLNLDELPPNQTAAAILGTGAVCCALSVLFYLPWLYVQVIRKDYTVRWWHFFYGPLLWRRQPPADAEEKMAVPDYYLGHHNDKDVFNPTPAQDPEAMHRANSDDNVSGEGKEITVDQLTEQHPATLAAVEEQYSSATHDRYGRPLPPKYRHYEGSAIEPWNAVIVLRYNALPWLIYSLTAGVRTDIHKAQATQGASEKEILRLRRVHAHAEHFDNEAEHAFSFLQVLTACTASFAHGANDVANAIAPLTVVYSVWSSAEFPSSREPVPIWILVYGGAMISIGLGIYGWRMMAVLGNRLTLHSPSRGFSMEFGASITVVLASYLALPVSTTQSITGATLAVSLCEGTWRSTNWKGFAWVFMSWVYTLPCAGLISGLLMAIVLNAPGWGTDVGIRP